jgi:hypothetical protein
MWSSYLEWSDACREGKGNRSAGKEISRCARSDHKKEFEEAQQEVVENQDAHLTCALLDHYLDLFHLCNGKFMDTQEPINHTKLLHKWGYKFKHFL